MASSRERPDDDQLGEQRVVVDGDRAPLGDAGVDTDPGPGRLPVAKQGPGLRQETARRILGVDTTLDGVAALRQILLAPRQRLAGGDRELGLDQVDADDRFGDRVLDLEPGVDLEEVEPGVVALAFQQELDRAGVLVAGRGGGGHRGGAHPRPQRRRERRARRFLDHLLMTALGRALALEQVDQGPVPIAEDLDLDVPRTLDQPLDVERAIAERGGRFAAGLGQRRRQVVEAMDRLHPDATAAGRGLDQQRTADAGRRGDQGRIALVGRRLARHHRYAG